MLGIGATIAGWLADNQTAITAAQNLLTALAIVAGLIWFVLQTKFRQRIEFDLGCRFIHLKTNPGIIIVEVQFIFKNTGLVEHRIYDLQAAIHALSDEKNLQFKVDTRELRFHRRLLPLTPLVPAHLNYFFVRPGVRQVITHVCALDSPGSVIRVTASFSYNLSEATPHYARRVFRVPEANPEASSHQPQDSGPGHTPACGPSS